MDVTTEFFREFLCGKNFNILSYENSTEPKQVKCPVAMVSLSAADITIHNGLRTRHRFPVKWKEISIEKETSSYVYQTGANTLVFWFS